MQIGYDETTDSYFINGLKDDDIFILAGILATFAAAATKDYGDDVNAIGELLMERSTISIPLALEIAKGLKDANLMAESLKG